MYIHIVRPDEVRGSILLAVLLARNLYFGDKLLEGLNPM